MKRYPVIALVLMSAAVFSGCAHKKTQEEVSQIARRVGYLENEVVEVRTEMNATKEDIHDQDLRLQFLEYEAVQRGEPIAPRRSMSTPDPMLAVNGGRVVLPEPLTPAPVTPAPAPSSTSPSGQSSALSRPPVHTTQPAPVTQTTPAANLPESPASTASPQPPAQPSTPQNTAPVQPASPAPGTLPAPVTAEPAPVEPPQTSPAPETQTVASLPQASQSGVQVQTPRAEAPSSAEQKAYDAALQLYRTGRFNEAEAAFQAFLQVYPDSRLVPNALYWQGETFYARQMFADAIFAFKDVQTRFPQNQKTPDSLLKTAMAYQKLGDTANASLHLAVLYEDWPNSEATRNGRRMGLRP